MTETSQGVAVKSALLVLAVSLLRAGGEEVKYGAFDVVITRAETCHGPKSRDCSSFNIAPEPGGRVLALSVDAFEDVEIEVGKVATFALDPQHTMTPLLHMQLMQPCKHVFLRPIFDQVFNYSENCRVRKGVYKQKVDIAKATQDYYGGKCLYGNFTLKSVFTGKNCNFACASVDFSTKPKQ